MVRRLPNFEAVARLSVAEAAVLMRNGDPQERVWASWVLGRAFGAQAVHGLLVALDGESDPGVRRHILVVIAGLGAKVAVARAAAKDAHMHVRATATRYLARLCEPGDAAGYDLFVARTLDLGWAVRYAAADSVRTDAPAPVVRAIAGLLFDPDPEVREAMQRRIARGDFPRAPFEAALAVLERVDARSAAPANPAQRALVKYRGPLRLV